MKIKGAFLVGALLVFGSFIACAQEKAINEILEHFYNVDIEYFTALDHQSGNNPLFKAFKSYIEGDELGYLEHLQEASQKEENPSKPITRLLFYAYVKNGQSDKAFKLSESENLRIDQQSNLDYARSIFGKARIQMKVDSTTVDFDKFYFNAIVNNTDTVRVFLDTGAPGIGVKKKLVEKYNWEVNTAYSQEAFAPFFNIRFKRYPVLIPNLSIGEAHFYNIPGSFDNPSEEDRKKLNQNGVEDYDIIMGLDLFYGLIDGVDINYRDSELTLINHLDDSADKPNFMRVSGKPAIQFELNSFKRKAFVDTGSPRHVLINDLVKGSEIIDSREASFGSRTYGLHTLKVDELLGLSEIELEFADYGFVVDEKFQITNLFGSFTDRNLSFDLKNRIVKLK